MVSPEPGGHVLDKLHDHLVQDLLPALVVLIGRVDQHNNRTKVGRLERPGPAIGVGELDRGTVLVTKRGDVANDQADAFAVSLDEYCAEGARLGASTPSAPVPAK